MKRMICYFLACVVIIVLIAGCVTNQPTNNTSTTTLPEETKPEKGSSLVEFDPDRKIYFLCETSLDMYEYMTLTARFSFSILSKEALDQITVSIPTSHPYTVEQFDVEIPRATEYMQSKGHTMKFYVYEAYRGVDFYNTQDADIAGILEDFKNLTTEDIPEFYRYDFRVMFDNTIPFSDEEITHMDVTIDGELYQPELGRVRFFSKESSPYNYKVEPYRYGMTTIKNAYNDGLLQYSLWEEITVEEDTVVKSLDFLGDEWEVLQLSVSGTCGGMSTNFLWDGKTPFDLYTGDRITISGVLYNPKLTGPFYQTLLQAIVSLESNNEVIGRNYRQLVLLYPDSYELNAIIFDGVDMEPYYRGYYYQQPPELWRKPYLDKIQND